MLLRVALLLPIVAADFYLQVSGSDARTFNVSKYDEGDYLILYGDRSDSASIVVDPVIFTYDGALKEKDGDYVQIADVPYEKKDTLILNGTDAYSCFAIHEGLLLHTGSSTFYLCNGYPLDKYYSFIQTDPGCFLAKPIQLKVIKA